MHNPSMSLNDALGDQLYYGSSRGEHVYYWDAEEVEGREPTAVTSPLGDSPSNAAESCRRHRRPFASTRASKCSASSAPSGAQARMQRWQEKKASVDLKDDALAAACADRLCIL